MGGVIHCFTVSLTLARQALGFYIACLGIVTFENAKNINVQDVATEVPLQRLLIETHAPYLTPVPLREKLNQPENIKLVAEYLAELIEWFLSNTLPDKLRMIFIRCLFVSEVKKNQRHHNNSAGFL